MSLFPKIITNSFYSEYGFSKRYEFEFLLYIDEDRSYHVLDGNCVRWIVIRQSEHVSLPLFIPNYLFHTLVWE